MNKVWRGMGNLSTKTKVALALFIAAATVGGIELLDKKNNNESDNEPDAIDKTEIKVAPNTYGEYLARLRPLEPMIIADLIAKEGVKVNAQGLHVPYKCSRGVWTIGFGCTHLKDGSPVTAKTKPITTEEAYELAQWHLEHETFLLMYWYDVISDNVNINTTEEAFTIASIMYNAYANLVETPSKKNKKTGKYTFKNVNYDTRSELLRNDFKKYGTELPASVVLERFEEYPITHMESFGKAWLGGKSKEEIANSIGNFLAGGKGLWWRRWLEAEEFLGNVTPEMMLNCPVGGMYAFFQYAGDDDKGNWFQEGQSGRRVNNKTFEKFRTWIQDPKQKDGASLRGWKKAKDWLPPHARQLCEEGKCVFAKTENIVYFTDVAQQMEDPFQAQYDAAMESYKAEQYSDAARKFEELIKKYPQNILLHNDLAATYNKLKKYDDALAQCKIVIKGGDKSQLGAAYFNAGFAREQKGELEAAQANYELAVKNGNRNAQSDLERVKKRLKTNAGQQKQGSAKAKSKTTSDTKSKSKSKTKSKAKPKAKSKAGQKGKGKARTFSEGQKKLDKKGVDKNQLLRQALSNIVGYKK